MVGQAPGRYELTRVGRTPGRADPRDARYRQTCGGDRIWRTATRHNDPGRACSCRAAVLVPRPGNRRGSRGRVVRRLQSRWQAADDDATVGWTYPRLLQLQAFGQAGLPVRGCLAALRVRVRLELHDLPTRQRSP